MEKKENNPEIREMLDKLGAIANLMQHAQESTLRKKWFVGNSGENIPIPSVDAKTLYVDNTANANILTLKLDGDLGVWIVPASGSRYIPCEGNRSLLISGIGQCFILAVNRELFLGN